MDPLNIQINTEHGPVSPFLHRLNNICVRYFLPKNNDFWKTQNFSTLGLTLVIYVFFLVLYRTPDYMKSYSRMMLLCGMADAYLLIVDIWCQSVRLFWKLYRIEQDYCKFEKNSTIIKFVQAFFVNSVLLKVKNCIISVRYQIL
jgi:hypothetical protein